jgi:hypothetical protein
VPASVFGKLDGVGTAAERVVTMSSTTTAPTTRSPTTRRVRK